MSEWQKIETAPKDGTAIIVLHENLQAQSPYFIASWDANKERWSDPEFHDIWISEVTHWMPLPEPPQ